MKNKRKIILLGMLVTFVATITLVPLVANANMWDFLFGEDTEEIVKFLKNHSDWLSMGTFLSVIFVQLGWLFVKGLYFLVALLEGLVPQSLSLLSFLEDAGIDSIVTSIINDLVVVLMVLSIVIIGIKTIVAKEPPNFKSVGLNIFISAFLILGLPTLMQTMEEVSIGFFNATQTGNNNGGVESLAWGLVQDNTADLFYVANNDFSLIENGKTDTVKNALTPEMMYGSNMAELITPKIVDDIDAEDSKVEYLKYTLTNDGQGNYAAMKIDNGMVSWFSNSFDNGYFRYPTKFFPVIFGLLALAVAYVFALFVFITTIIEIAIKRVVGVFVFATDLESGQKTKMVVKDILNAFLLIAFTGLNLKFYTLFLSYLASTDINLVLYIIALISATLVMIKGSSTIMRYFGVDVGVKEGFGQILGALAVAKGLGLGKFGGKNKNSGSGSGNSENGESNGEDSETKLSKDRLAQQGEERKQSINSNKKNTSPLKTVNSGSNNKVPGLDTMPINGMNDSADQKNDPNAVKTPNQKGESKLKQRLNALYNGSETSEIGEGKDNENNSSNTNEQRSPKRKYPENRIISNEVLDDFKNSMIEEMKANDATQQSNENSGLNNGPGAKPKQSNDAILKDIKANDALQQSNESSGLNNGPGAKQSNDAILKDIKANDALQQSNESNGLNNESGTKQSNDAILKDIKANDALQQSNESNGLNNESGTKQSNDKILKDMKANDALQQSNESNGLNNGSGAKQSNDAILKDMKANDALQQSSDSNGSSKSSNTGTFKQSNEEILTSMKANDALNQPKVKDVNANVNLNPSSQSIEGTNASGNQVSPSSKLTPEISTQTGQAVQKVLQQVERTSFSDPEKAKQSIIQEVQRGNLVPDGQKQQVIQDIKHSNQASVAQVKQNVESVFSAGNVPKEVQGQVQKVIQEVTSKGGSQADLKAKVIQEVEKASFGADTIKQTVVQDLQNSNHSTHSQVKESVQRIFNTSNVPKEVQGTTQKVIQEVIKQGGSPADVKSRVIQEVQNASIGGTDTIKQNVIQDLQKAFVASPEQMQQNITQTISSASNAGSNASEPVQRVVHKEVKPNNYFGKMVGEDLIKQPSTNHRQSRFENFKNNKRG